MCGRFTLDVSNEELHDYLDEHYHIEIATEFSVPRYNVAPGQDIVTIIHDGKNYRAGTLRWGFIPFFAKDEKMGYKMINAKAETLADKPSFKHSFKQKRCVILANGFYEWKKDGKEKQPYRIQVNDQKIFPLAGLWSSYTKDDGTKLYTCTIITTSPNEFMETIHNRMPVILTDKTEKIWLNPDINDPKQLESVLKPYASNLMQAYKVSTVVNNVKNESPQCIQPI